MLVAGIMLVSCAKEEEKQEMDQALLKDALCYNEDGIIVKCEDLDKTEEIRQQMMNKEFTKKYWGGTCAIAGKPGCIGLECFRSLESNCMNPFPCGICLNCGNNLDCYLR